MLVELGCAAPAGRHDDAQQRPVVVYSSIPDSYTFDPEVDTAAFKDHLAQAMIDNDGITNYEGAEAILSLVHPQGTWRSVAANREKPTWAWSDNENMQRFLAEFYGCPSGRPGGYEEFYWRRVGSRLLAPGVPFYPDATALLTNVGATSVATGVGGGNTSITGTATATSSTSLTSGTITSVTANQYAGYRIIAGSVWANIISHTSGTTPVFTVDQWYAIPDTGSAGTTPSSTSVFVILSGSTAPAWYMGLTTTNITPAATDTSLSGESTASGMARKISTYTVTSAASGSSITWTNSAVFTYGTSGALTFYAMGLFPSSVKTDTTDTLFWETSFSGSFTVTNNGDQATVTDTLTAS